MMGPLHRFRDNEHLKQLLDAASASGISIAEDDSADLPGAYWFRKGLGKVHGSVGTEDWESMMYFGFGHPFNPLLWHSDGTLLKRIETIFLSQGSERLHPSDLESEEIQDREQAVDPNRSAAPLLNSESSVRGSDD